MLRAYTWSGAILESCTAAAGAAHDPAIWYDLVDPTPDERRVVEEKLAIAIPTRAEMEEIEISSRLYHEDGAEFMTITALTNLDGDDPVKSPVTFILKDALVTVRFAEPKPFGQFVLRAQKAGGQSCTSGELAMFGLIEALVDRLADVLERVGSDIDHISHDVFRPKATRPALKTRDLQAIVEKIGRKGDLLGMTRESLVSMVRLVTYHQATGGKSKSAKDARVRAKVMQRDLASLADHATYLSSKINFLLDATLGLINLEQNQIIKIVSVAAVVFLPPTLVASIYGMNFESMPELSLPYGYPIALGVMAVSAVLPFLYFKRRGWL